jgi:hypothetical protein
MPYVSVMCEYTGQCLSNYVFILDCDITLYQRLHQQLTKS